MRYLTTFIEKDLRQKMVFVAGPRQVGKTTMAQTLMRAYQRGEYLNWDNPDHRRLIQKREWRKDADLIVFGELHKLKRWKTWIKGIYDVEKGERNFLVTGSARLDLYRRGGDSLQGRYHYWRLHPFSLDEQPLALSPAETLERLLERGGFPEPYLATDLVEVKRWRRERYGTSHMFVMA